jgi:hypothetical protein
MPWCSTWVRTTENQTLSITLVQQQQWRQQQWRQVKGVLWPLPVNPNIVVRSRRPLK